MGSEGSEDSEGLEDSEDSEGLEVSEGVLWALLGPVSEEGLAVGWWEDYLRPGLLGAVD